ncbi:MAG TPA: PDZ domain-containing protein [Gemmatimonadaceae bacterium]|nr:PDZ domain-containing protein [Gemmatimonadaceae bacterium]
MWIGTATGGDAKRLTTLPGNETDARFSPDGKTVAFTGQADGSPEVYLMSVDGGVARRLTFDPYGVAVQGWTADGSRVLYRSARENDEPTFRLYAVDTSGGAPEGLPLPPISLASAAPDKRRIAYVPPTYNRLTFGYRGGQAGDIWIADTNRHTFRKLTRFSGVDTSPCWSQSGLYFISERNGAANLFELNVSTGVARALTKFTDHPVTSLGCDEGFVIFAQAGAVHILDTRTSVVARPAFHLRDWTVSARRVVPVNSGVRSFDVSPNLDKILVSTRGQLVSADINGKSFGVIHSVPGSRAENGVFSPDGKRIAFVSDASGDEEIWIQDAQPGALARQVTNGKAGPLASLVWSPDGKWLAGGDHELRVLLIDVGSGTATVVDQAVNPESGSYSSVNSSYRFSPDSRFLAYAKWDTNDRQSIYLFDVVTRSRTRITPRGVNSFSPVFDPGGDYLYFLADREYNGRRDPNTVLPFYASTTRVSLLTLRRDTRFPRKATTNRAGSASPRMTIVDLDGIATRAVDLPLPTGDYDRIDAVYGTILLGGQSGLSAFNLAEQKLTPLNIAGDYRVATDGRHVLVRTAPGTFTLIDPTKEKRDSAVIAVSFDSATIVVDQKAEWRQIIEDAGRAIRRYFYDPSMRGLDWGGVVRKYVAQVPALSTREDVTRVLQDLLAELRTSHARVQGGDITPPPVGKPMGFLGGDFRAVPGVGAFKIVRLLSGDPFDPRQRSPLLAPGLGVHPGSYIVGIDGERPRPNADLNQYLVGKGNSEVKLLINSAPTDVGAQEIVVKALGDESKLRHAAWTETRRKFVEKRSGGRITYVHLPTMMREGLEQIGKYYYSSRDASGIIFDVRNNGGGSIAESFLLQLANPPRIFHKPRYGESWTRQSWGFGGLKSLLCDGSSGSNAEEFCYGFKDYKLGPVVGSATEGGVIGGCCGHTLVDGGSIMIPNYLGWALENGRPLAIIEGQGVLPNIHVDFDPVAYLAGRDAQLERAVTDMLSRLRTSPPPVLRPPQPSSASRTPVSHLPPVRYDRFAATHRPIGRASTDLVDAESVCEARE